MSDIVKKILHTVDHKPGDGHPDYVFWCPGCGCGHGVWVQGSSPSGAGWTFNGDFEHPTFSPSIKITQNRGTPPVTPENFEQWQREPWEQTTVTHICHSVVTAGIINYCGDCTHALAGQSVPMEAF